MVHRPNQMNALIQFLITISEYSYFKKRCQKKSKKPISQDCKVIWEFLKLANNAGTI